MTVSIAHPADIAQPGVARLPRPRLAARARRARPDVAQL